MSRVHLSLLLCFAVSPFVQSSPALRSIDDSPAATYDALSSNAALSATFLETHSERVGSVASRAALFSEGGDPPPDAAAPPAADPAAAPAAPQGDGCSVCTYVLENKEVQQPFLCRGLSDPAQQIMVCTAWHSGALTLTPPHATLSSPLPCAVRQGSHVAALVDGQPGVLDQLWLPAKRERRVVVGESPSFVGPCISGGSSCHWSTPPPPAGATLPTACDLQLDKALYSRRRGVLPRADRLPQAAMRPAAADAFRRDDCESALTRAGCARPLDEATCSARGSAKVGSRIRIVRVPIFRLDTVAACRCLLLVPLGMQGTPAAVDATVAFSLALKTNERVKTPW